MPFTVDPASIRMRIANATAKPDIDLTLPGQAICNLTSGYTKGAGAQGIARAFTAFVNATVTGSDPSGGTDFGFIQFCEQIAITVEYSGAIKSLGSIALSPAEKPAWSSATTLLDSRTAHRPWTAPAPRFALTTAAGGNQLSTDTGDHPFLTLGLTLQNKKTAAQ